jgi:chemotaxis-related protein WspB
MLFLLFQAGDKHYAVEAKRVQEIIPRVQLLTCPGAPDYVAGLFNYRGTVVPVVDFCRLVDCPPSRSRLSTRILLTPYASAHSGQGRFLGLMVETLIETLEKNSEDFSQAGLATTTTPFLGNIHCDGKRLIQKVGLEQLLTVEAEAILFPANNPGD